MKASYLNLISRHHILSSKFHHKIRILQMNARTKIPIKKTNCLCIRHDRLEHHDEYYHRYAALFLPAAQQCGFKTAHSAANVVWGVEYSFRYCGIRQVC